MRRHARLRVLGAGMILAIVSTAVVGLGSQSAGASVVSQCGPAIAGSPLATVGEGVHENNTALPLFQERMNLTLASALSVDITPTGTYPTKYSSVAQLNPSNIGAGTAVDSYFVYSDPVGKPTTPVHYSTTLTFSTPILGLIVQDATLGASDGSVGAPGTTYSTAPFRGLELGTNPIGADSVELVSPNSLYLSLNTSVDVDEVRVITAATEPGAFNGTAPQYTEVAADGGIFNFGSQFFGSMGGTRLNQPMVGGASACGTPGYWTVASDGGIFAFGGAGFFGSTGGIALTKPVVGMAPTPDGLGYWLAASDGGVFAFGDAGFHGSMHGVPLNQPVVGMAGDTRGTGYWLVASDGGIFSFGTAGFFGSTGAIALNKPIVAMAPTPDGLGYWLVASDGGVFAFGDAGFFGSMGGVRINQPVVGMKPTVDGGGYWLFAADGGVFAFGDAAFLGSMGGTRLNQPVVGGF